MTEREVGPGERANPERLEELYERARELGPEARAAFLSEACGGDSRLERELSSLLAHGETGEAFFAGLAEVIVSPAVGHQVGRYRLIGILGTGGMGTVYRAHDTRLDRVVALKFLPSYLSAQPEARERFLVEARAAAALDHPNVCSIHEIGETADGRPFIAMACYEGETLKERLSRGPLPPAEAVRIALQLARGLGAAHDRGIIHRDVKPGNVVLPADGMVRLLDFGLAKVSDVSITGPGVTPGTIAYMSPEQARGDPVDPRTDLWSLGVVLYEMLTGTRPFRGGNDRVVIQAIFHESPDPLHKRMRGGPSSLARTVERLLQKAPEDRYQSADELARDLAGGTSAGRMAAVRDWTRKHTRTVAVAGAGLIGVIALLSLGWLAHRPGNLTAAPDLNSSTPTIAVLPFTVRGPGLEVWHEGMVDLLSMGLDGAAGIRTVNSRTLLARWHQEVGDRAHSDLPLALGVARRTGARYALVGSAVAAGGQIRLGAQLYEVGSGRVLGPVQVEGPADSVLSLVDRLGVQTLGLIPEKDPGEVPALNLASMTTSSLVALKAYLQGEDHYRRSENREAAEAWEQAVRADTLFALAYLGLADAYAWLANYTNALRMRFVESLEHAKAMEQRLPGRERTTMEIRWERLTGVRAVVPTIREALRKYPDAADIWYELGEAYLHDAVAMSGPEQAEEAFRKAAGLQPTMAPYRMHLLDLAFNWHADSAQVARELEADARLAPDAPRTRGGRIAFALAFGDSGARARARAEVLTLDSESAAQVYFFLAHPRFAQLRDAVYRTILPRLDESDRMAVQETRFRVLGLMDGRVHDALATLDEPGTPGFLRYVGPLYLSMRGMPVPEELLKRTLAAARKDSSLFSTRTAAMFAAGTAARLGDWSGYNDLVSRMRELAARGRAAGDTASAGYWDWAVQGTEAHGLWRQGRKEEALQAFESTLPFGQGWFTLWNVGQLSLELGRLDQAERAFRALWGQDATPAYLQLARILERTGRLPEAREAYQFVAYAWRHADPELQPLVEETRQVLLRLPKPD